LEFEEPEIIAKVSLELVTPMIGGGAVAGVPDEHWPIRPTEIRGHLRFWWRAVEGYKYDAKEMRRREMAIFGSAAEGPGGNSSGRSKIDVVVSKVQLQDSVYVCSGALSRKKYCKRPHGQKHHPDCGRTESCGFPQCMDRAKIPHYVKDILLQDTKKKLTGMDVIPSATFDLKVTGSLTPEDTAAVRRALGAWVEFGGIGARTRRGAGSLRVVNGSNGKLELDKDTAAYREIPRLPGSLLWTGPKRITAAEAWTDVINLYRCIRKNISPDIANPPFESYKNLLTRHGSRYFELPNQGLESHSGWPEAMSLRGGAPTLACPRAAMGLPIKFQDSWRKFSDCELNHEDGRLASPIITKAISVGEHFKGCLLLLKGPRQGIDGLKMNGKTLFDTSISFKPPKYAHVPDLDWFLAAYMNPLSSIWTGTII
jgi:CRISPR-associated protein Cmr1